MDMFRKFSVRQIYYILTCHLSCYSDIITAQYRDFTQLQHGSKHFLVLPRIRVCVTEWIFTKSHCILGNDWQCLISRCKIAWICCPVYALIFTGLYFCKFCKVVAFSKTYPRKYTLCTEVEITVGHRSIFERFFRMTAHFSTCSVSVTDHVRIIAQLVYLYNGARPNFRPH